ncbi:MAG: DMT family transporter [Mogibacterium sp.]|nr:DMT family transporter [Mogibacterium sp.]
MRNFKNYSLIIAAGCLWGTIGLFVKLLEQAGSSSEYTTFLRMFFAFVMLLVITLIRDGAGAFKTDRGTLISCILLGFVSMSLNNLFYARAVSSLGMSLAAALLYSAPIFTSIESRILFKEHIGKNKITAIALSALGCVLAATGGNFSSVQVSGIGILFGVGAAFAYSTQNIFGRLATNKTSAFVVSTYQFMFASIFTLLVGRPFSTVADPLDPKILMYGALFALIPTTIAYLLYFSGVKGITESSKVPVMAAMELVVATILGIVVFREDFSVISIAGALLILVSIAIMSRGGEEKNGDPE